MGVGDYTFSRINDGVWYEFDTFRVEEGAQGYISMMSIIELLRTLILIRFYGVLIIQI